MRWVQFRRPSPAMTVALLALFVALGGGAYAALKVGSAQIVNNSVRGKDIHNNDVASKDVRDRSLVAEDFKADQLPAGPAGPEGARGPQGPPGPSGVPPQQTLQLGAYASSLPSSASPLSGGCINLDGGPNDFVRLDLPLPIGADLTGVRVRYQDTSVAAALAASVHVVNFSAGTIQDDILGPAVSSAPPPVVGLLNLDLGGNPNPVSATRIYYLNVNVAATALPGFTRFCGASVDYTLP